MSSIIDNLSEGVNNININITNTDNNNHPKFKNGENARKKWSKNINKIKNPLSIEKFKEHATGAQFVKYADITLDDSKNRQTTIMAIPCNILWEKQGEYIYLFLYNGKIVKVGGTRKPMKMRFGSYLCGHHVRERGKSGKMSVTNAHIYHTMEKTLLDGDKWEIYVWQLEEKAFETDIMGETEKIVAQTYHKYESKIMKLFKKVSGEYPILSDNCDPN